MNWGLIVENSLTAAVGDFAMVWTIAAVGLNLHYGYTGLLNFGQAVFMAAGAYGLAMIVATIGPQANDQFGWNLSETTLF